MTGWKRGRLMLIAAVFAAVCAFLLPAQASAATEGVYTYTVSDGAATITAVSETVSGNIAVPETLGGCTVTTIDSMAFYNCTKLTGVVIPSGVTSIGPYAFEGCSSLTSFSVAASNASFANDASGVILSKDGKKVVLAPSGLTGGYIVPDGVTTIGMYAFDGCDKLTGISIPATLKQVEDYALRYCEKLSTVFFRGTKDKKMIQCGIKNGTFEGAKWHYDIQEALFADQACLYCPECDNYYLDNGYEALATVVYKNPDGTIIEKFYMAYNEAIPRPANPGMDHAHPTQYRYAFTGWDKPVPDVCTGNAVFTALYQEQQLVLYYEIQDGKATVTGCKEGVTGELTIPANFGAYPVTGIAKNAFAGCSGLTAIRIPASVTDIADAAFYGCAGLTAIYVDGGNPNYTGDTSGVLYSKDMTTLMAVPQSLSGTYTIPSGVKEIAGWAFYGCSELTGITIGSDVTAIGEYAFFGCSGLSTITIPANVTQIGARAFGECSSVTAFKVGSDNTAFSTDFYGVLFNKDKSVLIVAPQKRSGSYSVPYGVIRVEDYAFAGCSKLTRLNFTGRFGKYTVATLGRSAFAGCSGLSSITIPASVSSIGRYAFDGCTNISSFSVASGNLNFSKDSYGVLFNKDQTTLIAMPKKMSGSYTIPATVTSIAPGAFEGCTNLTGISIPAGVERIDDYMFYGCTGLSTVTIADGVSGIGEYAFYGCSTLSQINIPTGVTQIGPWAFGECSSLTEIELPSGVTKIGDAAFWNCASLNRVTMPAGVRSVGAYAFYGCSALTDIRIPSGVTTIGDHAFYGCAELSGVVLGENVKQIGYAAFANCAKLVGVYMPASLSAIDDYAFYGCSALKDITIPSGVTMIGDYAFYGCSSLTAAAIPAGVNGIGQWAFGHCTSLSDVTIARGVKQIGYAAFGYCSALTKIQLPKSLNGIDGYAFCCTGLTDVQLPEGLTEIGYAAFSYCTGLTKVSISEDVTAIGNWAFGGSNVSAFTVDENSESFTADAAGVLFSKDMTQLVAAPGGLTGIYAVPNSVNGICTGAFYGCSQLAGLELPVSVVAVGEDAFYGCAGLKTVFYGATESQKADISVNDTVLSGAVWHYSVEKKIFSGQSCYYCAKCNDCYLPDGEQAKATIMFMNWDGSGIATRICAWGETVELPAVPARPADQTYTYTFAGWDKEIVPCAGDAVYRAVHTPTYIDYTVEFKNWDGSLLSSKTYHYGDAVTVPQTPSRTGEEGTVYTFVGWDKKVTACAGNTTYTAVFTDEKTKHEILFLNWDGTGLSTKVYTWGETVTAPAAPTRPADETYTYTFAGWDKEVVPCAGDAIYIAVYTPVYIDYTVEFKNWDGSLLSSKTYHYGDAVTVPEVPARPDANGKTFTFLGWDKEVTACTGNAAYTACFKMESLAPETITSKIYTIRDGVCSNISCGTDVQTLLDGLDGGKYSKVYQDERQLSGTDMLGTGMTVKLFDGDEVIQTLVIVLTGDTNGDGTITITDMLAIKSQILEKNHLSEASALAADINGDGKVTVTDFVQIKAHILGSSEVVPH